MIAKKGDMDYNPQPISLIAEKKYLAGLQPDLVLHNIYVWWLHANKINL
jgi:hypothetical protein